MKPKLFFASLALLAALVSAFGGPSASASDLANETSDLPLYTGSLPSYILFVTIGLSLGMLALLEIGRRIGTRHLIVDPDNARKGLAAIDGTIFSLLGLLVAFSFHGAARRFDARRELVIEEAARIHTAWLQLDMLAREDRAALQGLLRQYLDSRLETYRKLPDAGAVKAELARSRNLQDQIWQRAIAAFREPGLPQATTHLVPALNQMFDIASTRIGRAGIHPPKIIFAMLSALTLISALLIGHGMAGRKTRSLTHIIGVVMTMVAAIYLIYELEFPRLGLVRIDEMDQVLVELRQRMN
jgi:hypothetical protein